MDYNQYEKKCRLLILLILLLANIFLSSQAKKNSNRKHEVSSNIQSFRRPAGVSDAEDDDLNDSTNNSPSKHDGGRSSSRIPFVISSGREFTLFQSANPRPPKTATTLQEAGRKITLFPSSEPSKKEARTFTDPSSSSSRRSFRPEQQVRAGSSSSGTTPSSYPNYYRRRSDSQYYIPEQMRTNSRQNQWRFLQPLANWWSANVSPNVKSWPKIVCRVEPTTTLKLRKTFRPLGTIVRLGANFNTQLQVWQFKSDWEDAIIGGKLTLAGRELQLTKSWQLSVGAMEDLVTRLRFRAAVDLSTWKAYARVGFRTERLSPINVMEGFTLQKEVPLDGLNGHVKLQVKANFALPEPEIEYSTETQRSLIGMGDIQVSLEELNLLLDY